MTNDPFTADPNTPDKRARRDDSAAAVELDHVEEMIRNEVLEALLGRQQLCSCGKLIEVGEMFRHGQLCERIVCRR